MELTIGHVLFFSISTVLLKRSQLWQLVRNNLNGKSSNRLQDIIQLHHLGMVNQHQLCMLDNHGGLNEDINDAFVEKLRYNNSLTAGNTTGSAQTLLY